MLNSPRRLRRINAQGELENYSNSLNVFMMMDQNDGSSFSEYVNSYVKQIIFEVLFSILRYELLFDDEDDPADVQYLIQTDND